jgi:hypothetical protein
MTAQELEIGYSPVRNFPGNIDANEDVFAEAAGIVRRPGARPVLRKRPAASGQRPTAGLFDRGGATNLLTKFGAGAKEVIKGSQQNRALKQKAKLAESAGMAKAAQIAARPTPESAKKDNTMKYVLIGVGSLAILGIAVYAIKKLKK